MSRQHLQNGELKTHDAPRRKYGVKDIRARELADAWRVAYLRAVARGFDPKQVWDRSDRGAAGCYSLGRRGTL